MSFGNISKKKLRAKIIRKGIFTQLSYPDKVMERENKMFRTALDYALYDLTGKKERRRKEVLEWLKTDNVDFQLVCYYSGLDHLKVYAMFLFFLKNYFSEIYQEFYCHEHSNGDIVRSQTPKRNRS